MVWHECPEPFTSTSTSWLWLLPQSSEQCLAHTRCSVNVCQNNEWVNEPGCHGCSFALYFWRPWASKHGVIRTALAQSDVRTVGYRIIHLLLFLGRTPGLGFHTVVCRMDWETANLGFFIYQTKQTQTFNFMAGISKWMISLNPFNNGMRPLASCRLSLGGG